jgi:hypothetical protein
MPILDGTDSEGFITLYHIMKAARVIRIGLAHSLRLFKIQRSKITEQFFPVRNRKLYFNFQHVFSPADSFTAYKTRRNCSGSEQLQQG